MKGKFKRFKCIMISSKYKESNTNNISDLIKKKKKKRHVRTKKYIALPLPSQIYFTRLPNSQYLMQNQVIMQQTLYFKLH